MTLIERLQGLIGIVVLLGLAWLMSDNRRRIDWRIVLWGLVLQVIFAGLILRTPVGHPFFEGVSSAVTRLISFTNEGTTFLFKPLNPAYETGVEVIASQSPREEAADNGRASVENASETATEPLAPGTRIALRSTDGPYVVPGLINLGLWVLPTVIFFSGLLSLLYHLGVMQFVVRGIAWLMVRTMGTSGAETLCVAANIFVGQTEAPMMVRPFLKSMTRSELLTVMLGGFATVAGGVYAVYVSFLDGQIPDIAGHLMAASVMSAPAALAVAKILIPETETPETFGTVRVSVPRTADNLIEAFGDGVSQGLVLTLNMAAMLIAFIAMVALVNGLLALIPTADSQPLTLQWLLGILFRPIAWSLGVSWQEAEILGTLLGEKLVLTEMIAYLHLSTLQVGTDISPRTAVIASYALCGFANFASIGIQLGGLGGMAPERKRTISELALRAMLGGALASWLTAAVAGMLI